MLSWRDWCKMRTLFLVGVFLACESRYDPESHWEEGPLGVVTQGMTVADATGCSTSVVNALSEQLIEQINCLRPNTLRSFENENMSLGPAVFPFLQGQGPEDLQRTILEEGRTLQINSALRTLPQQYLLYRWWQQGECGIQIAARPGRSRHESGLAIDISNYSSWIESLTANGFRWFGEGDRVHFDYEGDDITDLAGLSILSFQMLWNQNNPDDLILEDGLYGPQTEARIRRSPADGFEIYGCAHSLSDDQTALDMGRDQPSADAFPEVDSTDAVLTLEPDGAQSMSPLGTLSDAGALIDPSVTSSDNEASATLDFSPPTPDMFNAPSETDSDDISLTGGCAQSVSSHGQMWICLLVCFACYRTRERHG